MRYFYDIGANVGQTFDWFLLKDQRWRDYHVVCFEPSPRHLTQLADKCRQMRGSFADVTLVTAAVESTAGLACFYEKTSVLADSLVEGWKANRGDLRLEVPMIGLAQYLYAHTLPADRVTIKIDAEGSEYGMLWSILHDDLTRIEKLMVEWHGDHQAGQRQELEAEFRKRGLPIEEWPF